MPRVIACVSLGIALLAPSVALGLPRPVDSAPVGLLTGDGVRFVAYLADGDKIRVVDELERSSRDYPVNHRCSPVDVAAGHVLLRCATADEYPRWRLLSLRSGAVRAVLGARRGDFFGGMGRYWLGGSSSLCGFVQPSCISGVYLDWRTGRTVRGLGRGGSDLDKRVLRYKRLPTKADEVLSQRGYPTAAFEGPFVAFVNNGNGIAPKRTGLYARAYGRGPLRWIASSFYSTVSITPSGRYSWYLGTVAGTYDYATRRKRHWQFPGLTELADTERATYVAARRNGRQEIFRIPQP